MFTLFGDKAARIQRAPALPHVRTVTPRTFRMRTTFTARLIAALVGAGLLLSGCASTTEGELAPANFVA